MKDGTIEFGVCQGCHSIRWHSNAAYAKFGVGCTTCGSKRWTPIKRITPLQRMQVLGWLFWENRQCNHWVQFLNPYVLIRLTVAGLFPKIKTLHQESNDASATPLHS